MESYEVKTTEEYGSDEIDLKTKEFEKNWKPFDWTQLLNQWKYFPYSYLLIIHCIFISLLIIDF